MKSAAPKFKGTMLMMNQPGAMPPGIPAPGGAPGGAPRPGSSPGPASDGPRFEAEARPMGAGPMSGATGPSQAGPSKLKGTIVGVAPPKFGAAPAPPPQAAAAPPPDAQPPEQHQFGSGQEVNALGSTVAFGDGAGLPPGFPLPAAGAQAPAPGAPGGGGAYGGPPQPTTGGYGAPPGGDPYAAGGAPPGPYGAPQGAPPGQDYGAQGGPAGQAPGQPAMGQPGMQPYGGAPMQQYPGGPMMGPQGAAMAPAGDKSWMVTLLLCGFLGYLGAHRFYTGHYLIGALQLITCGGLGIWAFVDLIFILIGKYTDAQGRALAKS